MRVKWTQLAEILVAVALGAVGGIFTLYFATFFGEDSATAMIVAYAIGTAIVTAGALSAFMAGRD